MPLGTLVRLPGFKELRCPRTTAKACILSGTNLFLVQSVSASSDFTDPIEVPADYTAAQMAVPHPANGSLYLKLRDDPETVQTLNLPAIALSTPAAPPALSPLTPGPAGGQAPAQAAPAASVPADSGCKPGPKVN